MGLNSEGHAVLLQLHATFIYIHVSESKTIFLQPQVYTTSEFSAASHDLSSRQGRDRPGRPLGHVDRAGAHLHAARRRPRLEQVVVDVRVQIGRLRARERAVRVPADEREPHVVGHAVGLVDEAAGLHGARGRDGAEPVDVVLDDEETPGHRQRREEVVVLGHAARVVDVAVEARREPGVLPHDLARGLDVGAGGVLGVADAPGLSVEVGWSVGYF